MRPAITAGLKQILQEAVHEALDQRAEELLKTVTTEREEVERQQRLEQGKKEIRALIDQGAFSVNDALRVIDELRLGFGEDRELEQLRATAEQQRDIFEALGKIKDLEQQRQFEAALGIAEAVLHTGPESAELINRVERLRPSRPRSTRGRCAFLLRKERSRACAAATLDGAKKRFGEWIRVGRPYKGNSIGVGPRRPS